MLDSLVRVSRRAGGNHFVSLGRSRTSAAAEVPTRDTEAPPGGYPTTAAQADTLHEKHRARTTRYPGCPEDGRSGARQSREARLVSSASPSATSGTFNSLSKVLFTFPSWYFYAIGLESIFSFGWNLPPICAPVPRNVTRRRNTVRDGMPARRDSHPSACSFPRDLHRRRHW